MSNNRRIKILIFIILQLIFFKISVKAQDPNFSQFYFNPLYYNPAYTGITSGLNVRFNYRSLWTRVPSAFNTYNFSLDVEDLKIGGLGIIGISDVEGEGLVKNTTGGILYAHRLIIIPRTMFIQGGFMASYVQRSIDWGKLEFSDQFDKIMGKVYPTSFYHPPNSAITGYFDFSSGFVVRYSKNKRDKENAIHTIGASVHHLTQPDNSFFKTGDTHLPLKEVAHANSEIPFNNIICAPALIYEHQDQLQTVTIGMNVFKDPVYIGLWIRNRNFLMSSNKYDAVIIMLGINKVINDNSRVKIGYSYDITISKLGLETTHGSHEISLNLEFGKFILIDRKGSFVRKKKSFICPMF